MLNFKKIFAVALCAVNFVCTISFGNSDVYAENETPAIWDGTYDTSWYDSQEKELHIKTAEELAGMAELVNSGQKMTGQTIYLDNDIYLNDISNYDNWKENPPKNKWITISDIYERSGDTGALLTDYFKGTFDGQGNVISGLYQSQFISYDNRDYECDEDYLAFLDFLNYRIANNRSTEVLLYGLFGRISGNIKNVNSEYEFIDIKEIRRGGITSTIPPHIYVGGICSMLEGAGVISNCTVKGYFNTEISALKDNGSIDLDLGCRINAISGGICGRSSETEEIINDSEVMINTPVIENCASYGTICSDVSYRRIEDVVNWSGASCCAGGIIGWIEKGEVNSCRNSSEVKAERAGGIVGYGIAGSGSFLVKNSYNTGVIDTYAYGGGIIGYSDGISIINSYNTGKVCSTEKCSLEKECVGGIIGYEYDKHNNMVSCYYLSSAASKGIGDNYYFIEDTAIAKNSDGMKNESFAELLGDAYTYVEGDYPKLLWEVSKSIIYGDINNDNEVSIADLVMLQKYMTGAGELTDTQTADICCDGEINVFDVVSLRRMLIEKM